MRRLAQPARRARHAHRVPSQWHLACASAWRPWIWSCVWLCVWFCATAWPGRAAAQAAPHCSSDRQAPVTRLVERFFDANCLACWTTRPAPEPLAAHTVDWVLPAASGPGAAMAPVALREAAQRLAALPPKAQLLTEPSQAAQVLSVRQRIPVRGPRLRVAHGLALAGYVGAGIALDQPPVTDVQAWLLLLEHIPAGTEGTPVPRQLVRNVLVLDWPAGRAPEAYAERRPLSVPEGAQPERLSVLGWVQDATGRVLAAAASACELPDTPTPLGIRAPLAHIR